MYEWDRSIKEFQAQAIVTIVAEFLLYSFLVVLMVL